MLLFQSCMEESEPELFLIPNNYHGVVIVLFDQDNGQDESYIEGKRLYDIPGNGILLTKFSKTIHGKLSQGYYYKDSDGRKIVEIEDYFLGDIDGNKNYVMNGVYGQFTIMKDSINSGRPFQYYRFTIGKIKEKDSLQQAAEGLVQSLMQSSRRDR